MSTEPNLLRRHLLAAAIASPIALLAAPAIASASQANPSRKRDWRAVILDRDRYLYLERPQAQERASFCYYRRDQGWDQRGYAIACTLLRDVESKRTVSMDPRLIDLLYIIQAWLRLNNYPYQILVNSGFRTAAYNASLEGAAKNSQHIQARAADIRIPGLATEQLAKLAKAIGVGGVGVYPNKGLGFIHVDIGKVRSWRVALLESDQEDWLARYSEPEIEQALSVWDAPEAGRIIYT
ncbi:YcbK family protein [Pseudomonas sp. NPDC089569]|uniref:YcbK family protein n=1 Tax=Pseudomonas sp. NPDC089569 TaxID=3390722 RepID=UPI003CFF881D